MAIVNTDENTFVTRDNIFDPSSDFTLILWADVQPAPVGQLKIVWFYGNFDPNFPHLQLTTYNNDGVLYFQVWVDNTPTFTNMSLPLVASGLQPIVVRWNATTKLVQFSYAGQTAAPVVVDIGALTFAPTTEVIAFQTGVATGDFYYWATTLSDAQVTQQLGQYFPVDMNDLVAWTPLQSPYQLGDLRNGGDWVLGGSFTGIQFTASSLSSVLTDPHIFCEMYLDWVPFASFQSTTVKMTEQFRPISRVGNFYQPRIKSVQQITRVATDPDGNYTVGGTRIVVDDNDSFIGALLDAGTVTEYFLNREIVLWLFSKECFEQNLIGPITAVPGMFRGWMSDVQRNGREVTIEAKDVVGSQMVGYNTDKRVLTKQIKDLTENARDDSKDWYLPIYLGEFSDRGSPDVNGISTLKGIIPVKEVCEIDITTLGTNPDLMLVPPPVITVSGVVGTTGVKKYYYAATVITSYGETKLSNIVEVNGTFQDHGPGDTSNYNWIVGTYVAGASSPFNKVRILRSESPDPASFTQFLDEADYFAPSGNFIYGDGAKVLTYNGVDPPPATRVEHDELKAWMPTGFGVPVGNNNVWSVFAVCRGYGYTILDLYASDLADIPKRQLVALSEHGVSFIFPTDPEWPYPTPYIVMNGIRFTGFLARGPKVEQHRSGTVTMAVNICGPLGLNGLNINQAFYQFQFLLNEYNLFNKGTENLNNDYFALQTFQNGDPILMMSSFQVAQELSMAFMLNDVGYIGNIWIVDGAATWRDVIGNFCRTFGCRLTNNRFGQVKVFMVNTISRTVKGRHFRERIEIKHSEGGQMKYDEIMNDYNVSYFYDIDAGGYRIKSLEFANLDSQKAHVPFGGAPVTTGGVILSKKLIDKPMPYSNDAMTVQDVVNRELIRRRRRTRYLPITVGLLGLDHEIGEEDRVTDTQGLGPQGDVETPAIILEHTINIDDRSVLLRMQDLRSISNNGFATVGDNDLGTSHAVGDNVGPPITSVEVG